MRFQAFITGTNSFGDLNPEPLPGRPSRGGRYRSPRPSIHPCSIASEHLPKDAVKYTVGPDIDTKLFNLIYYIVRERSVVK